MTKHIFFSFLLNRIELADIVALDTKEEADDCYFIVDLVDCYDDDDINIKRRKKADKKRAKKKIQRIVKHFLQQML